MKEAARFLTILLLVAFFPAHYRLAAFGAEEEPARKPENTEWTLCITNFDVSALPPSRQIRGDAITRDISKALLNLDFRSLGQEETGYYRELGRSRARAAAAKNLAAKRNERDLLLYRGDPAWKYQKNLKAADEAIAKLEAELAALDGLVPAVEEKPAFKLGAGNADGTYPEAPEPGGEYRFCAEQKADAFLSGSLEEYYGRIYLRVKLYTLYTRSYSFEDSVLFSSEDLNEAVDEISGRLGAAVSGTLPSALLVRASPPDAMITIDDSYAGRGEAAELQSHSPGKAEIEVRADNHVPFSLPLELAEGELAELFIDLTPVSLSAFEAIVPGSPGSKVFLGSLYVGETPLTLALPGRDFAYISVETPEGETGSVVYRDNDIVRGSARFVRANDTSGGGRADFATELPVSPEERRVDRARRGFYRAYGALWFILPASLISAGIAQTHINVNDDKAAASRYIQKGAYGVMGAALGITFFQIFRYLYVSGEDAAPLVTYPDQDSRTEQ